MPIQFMLNALELAKEAYQANEVPVGAVIVHEGEVIASAANAMKHACDATGHAEIVCIRQACEVFQTQFLTECDLYVTLEPCPMCAGAIANARIRRVIFGAYDPKGGAVTHGARVFAHTMHVPEVIGGIEEEACRNLLKQFFEERRPT